MINTIFLQFLLLTCIDADKNGTRDNDNWIYWKEDYYLSWDDFKANYTIDTSKEATSTCSIKSHYASSDGLVMKFEIYAVFIKDKSSTKSDTSTYLLSHEQGHFDITEIFARQLRKRIIESNFSITNYKLQFDEIYQNTHKLLNECHDSYDLETNHSKNEIKQNEWNNKIKEQLKQLSRYSEPIISKEITK